MFFKYNDSLQRRIWLGIGEALLATCLFFILHILPATALGLFGSTGPSAIQNLAWMFAALIFYGSFALAGSLHVIIPIGALLGFLLPKVALKYKPVQAFLMGGIGGAILALGAMVLLSLTYDAQPVKTLRLLLTWFFSVPPIVIWCALWLGFRLAHLGKQIRAENSYGDWQTNAPCK